MEDYTSNSHKSKNVVESGSVKEEPKIKQAELKGSVKVKKKTGFQKFVGTFIAEDAVNVKSYLVNDVLIPNAKAAISEMVSNGINMILYGDSAPRRTTGQNVVNRIQKIQYGGYVNGGTKTTTKKAASIKNDFDFENIVFETRGDAEIVLDNLMDALERYEIVTVAGLYDAAGVETHNYMLGKYGWEDLSSARIVRAADGYILALPTPRIID